MFGAYGHTDCVRDALGKFYNLEFLGTLSPFGPDPKYQFQNRRVSVVNVKGQICVRYERGLLTLNTCYVLYSHVGRCQRALLAFNTPIQLSQAQDVVVPSTIDGDRLRP